MASLTECAGGVVDAIYHGLATGLCPTCGEFVPLLNTGRTIRHWAPCTQGMGG